MQLSTHAAAQLLRVVPRARLSRAVGSLCELELPAPLVQVAVRLYAHAFGVDLSEAMVPAGGAFRSFDAFFTRRLRAGARTFTSAGNAVVSPADGRLDAIGAVEAGDQIVVKGQAYSVADLILASGRETERYRGGQFAVVYLSPGDYHRVHAPVAGRVVEVRSSPGDLFPVNAIGQRIPGLLARNRRVAIAIDTSHLGRITVVMVGAMMVGGIEVSCVAGREASHGVHRFGAPRPVRCGDEIGVFHLGSTVVLICEPGLPDWKRDPGTIRLGKPLHAASAALEDRWSSG